MAGGLLQLSMRGEQDKYLNIRPDFSMFKSVWKKHSGFAIETHELYFNSTTFGSKSVCNILKDADLLTDITLRLQLPSLNIKSLMKSSSVCVKDVDMTCFCDKCSKKTSETIFGWANSIGHLMTEEFSFNVGSKELDKRTGEWMEWWSELAQTMEKKLGYWEMIGKREPASFKPTTFSDSLELLIPLNFFFTGKPGQSFPLVAIDEDNISVEIKWRDFNDCWVCNKEGASPGIVPNFKASLLVDYVFLDNFERHKFKSENHLYLIEQVQKNTPSFYVHPTSLPVVDLTFTQPVKSIYWAIQRQDMNLRSTAEDPDPTFGNDWFNYACYKTRYKNIIKDPFKTANLILNGEERMESLPAIYYRLYQSYKHHTKTPSNYIYNYNFGYKPEEHQPTGTCNMSMYNKIRLRLNMCQNHPTDYNVIVYALSYNFLIIKDRKVSLAFVI